MSGGLCAQYNLTQTEEGSGLGQDMVARPGTGHGYWLIGGQQGEEYGFSRVLGLGSLALGRSLSIFEPHFPHLGNRNDHTHVYTTQRAMVRRREV